MLTKTRDEIERGIAAGLHLGAQLYVSLSGRGRTELALGERTPGTPLQRDDLMLWLSTTKPVAAVAIAQLWERGHLELDDPIAQHVPAFAARGKDAITLRHALTHTGGFRLLDIGWPEKPWAEIVDTICRARPEPRWVPGEKAGYHLASSWFMLGEVVRKVDGRPFDRYVREEIFLPLGLDDAWVGMPPARHASYGARIAPMFNTKDRDSEGDSAVLQPWHEATFVVGCSPGGNGRGPIHALGRFYEMLLHRGALDGVRLLTSQTVEALTASHRVGMFDHTFKRPLDWGLGLIVNSEHYRPPGDEAPLVPYGYGRHASRRTFGHSGFQSSTAFADPEHGLVVALAVNGNPGEPHHTQRFQRLTEALYEDLGLVRKTAS